MRSRRAKVDRLSDLPDEILGQILSLIPTKSAVATSVLSKRWRYSWTWVNSFDFHHTCDMDVLSFDFHHADIPASFINFVDRVLNLYKTSRIERFRLYLEQDGMQQTSDSKSNISRWINKAVRLQASEIDLFVMPFELPVSLFTCETLTKLSLAGYGIEDIINPNVSIALPLLKTLHITWPINLHGKASVNSFRLIHSCPILESLSLETSACKEDEDYYFNIPTLKTLKLRTRSYITANQVFLNLPNLEELSVVGLLSSLFIVEDVSSLVKATVNLSDVDEDFFFLYTELLKVISIAKSISWSSPTLDVLLIWPMPKFPNLRRLKLRGSLNSRAKILFRHLGTCTKLKHLCFQEPKKSCWIKPQSVPIGMLSRLKTMKITKCKGRECALQFIECVLGNSEVLKRLTITCKKSVSKKDGKRLCEELSTFSRASKNCKIHFVGKRLSNIF